MTMKLIASSTVGSGGASSIELTSIPQTATDLVLRCFLRRDSASPSEAFVRINGVSTSSYSESNFRAISVTEAASTATKTYVDLNLAGYADNSVNGWSDHKVEILDYTSSRSKMILVNSSRTRSSLADNMTLSSSVVFSPTSAVTSLSIQLVTGTLAQNSVAYLYSITKGSDGIVGAS